MSLDRLEITPFANIAAEILQHRRTGVLTIVRPPLRKELYWSQGELVLSTSAAPEDSLSDFLVRRGIITPHQAMTIADGPPTEAVAAFHEAGVRDLSSRQTLLREWLASQFVPLFSLDEGTAAFSEDSAIDPDKRVFLQSTAALVLEGIRAISNGLVLRRSLGDIKREIAPPRESRYSLDTIPLNETERRIAASLATPLTIETFLKQFPSDSLTAAKVVIGMLTLGLFEIVDREARQAQDMTDAASMQRDLELLAAIGSDDQRSLRAIGLSRQLESTDHYHLLDLPRAATRAQIASQGELLKKRYDPATYPPAARPAVEAIVRRIDEAVTILRDPVKRQAYDKLGIPQAGGASGDLQQRATQRSIAEQNFSRAKELAIEGDYYGAIILLKQAVKFAPDHSEAWFLLGSCQDRNPKWRREAAESMQQALSIDPNHVDAMIALGDIYRSEGLTSRAQSCYDDVLKISPENQQAKSRLQLIKKR
jgi:tetratricopeptide (TPR) repeat protein